MTESEHAVRDADTSTNGSSEFRRAAPWFVPGALMLLFFFWDKPSIGLALAYIAFAAIAWHGAIMRPGAEGPILLRRPPYRLWWLWPGLSPVSPFG